MEGKRGNKGRWREKARWKVKKEMESRDRKNGKQRQAEWKSGRGRLKKRNDLRFREE